MTLTGVGWLSSSSHWGLPWFWRSGPAISPVLNSLLPSGSFLISPVHTVLLDLRGQEPQDREGCHPARRTPKCRTPHRHPHPNPPESWLYWEQSAQQEAETPGVQVQDWREVCLEQRGAVPPPLERLPFVWKPRCQFNKRALMPLGSPGAIVL